MVLSRLDNGIVAQHSTTVHSYTPGHAPPPPKRSEKCVLAKRVPIIAPIRQLYRVQSVALAYTAGIKFFTLFNLKNM